MKVGVHSDLMEYSETRWQVGAREKKERGEEIQERRRSELEERKNKRMIDRGGQWSKWKTRKLYTLCECTCVSHLF